MKSSEFNNDNLWHINADFMFGFQCQYCNIALTFDDVPECEPNKDFGAACVSVSDEAQKLGWKLIESFVFCCPSCSQKKV